LYELRGTDPVTGRDDVRDDELMAALAKGDRQALAELYERHVRAVFAYARRTLNHEAEAEDVAQEVFMRVYDHASRYRPEEHFRAWVLRICLNLCRDRLRRLTAGGRAGDDRGALQPDHGALPADQACDRHLAGVARDALAALSFEDRQIVALRLDAGLSARDAAEVLGCSMRTIQYHTARIFTTLRRKLGEKA
jgi:RNA polymerase sigma-70 factor, ECF subfamily